MNIDTQPKKIHQGKNIKRLREMLGIKQETLAENLGMTQASVSLLEQKEEIEDKTLEKVSECLKVPIGAIKNMTEESPITYINTFNDAATINGFQNYYPTFNPIDKVVELYERMLELERDKIKYLEEVINKRA